MTSLRYTIGVLRGVFADRGVTCRVRGFVSTGRVLRGVDHVSVKVLSVSVRRLGNVGLKEGLGRGFPSIGLICVADCRRCYVRIVGRIRTFSFLYGPLRCSGLRLRVLRLLGRLPSTVMRGGFCGIASDGKGRCLSVGLGLESVLCFRCVGESEGMLVTLSSVACRCSYVFRGLIRRLRPCSFIIGYEKGLIGLERVRGVGNFVVCVSGKGRLRVTREEDGSFERRMGGFLREGS